MNATAMGEGASEVFLTQVRFWVQRVLVPIVVLIGVSGNIVTVMVLTRRRMRCSTNIYLTALAVADVVYLFSVLLLSFRHYPNIHKQSYELYWRFNGIIHWLCDAASNTSVWLTVAFTLERYIAVCHPMRGKVLCTENRAKNIIAVISILCILTVASTSFEHQLSMTRICGNMCEPNDKLAILPKNTSHQTGNSSFCGVFFYVPYHNNTLSLNSSRLELPKDLQKNITSQSNLSIILVPCTFTNNFSNHKTKLVIENKFNAHTDSADTGGDFQNFSVNELPIEDTCANATGNFSENSDGTNSTNNNCCFEIGTEPTNLGKNLTYKAIFFWFTAITFTLLPLILIAIFNCFLIRALYESKQRRRRMTNSQEATNQSKENRITLILIGVVIMFLVCQTPTGVMVIFDSLEKFVSFPYDQNIKLVFNNIFNFLLAINAACNFLLYCVLSRKYRTTFKMLFCQRRKTRQDTLALSLSRPSQKFNPNSAALKRNATYYRTPRNLEESETEATLLTEETHPT